MKPNDGKKTKYKLDPRYIHNRSEGLTHRKNDSSKYQPTQKERK